jgi:hypothetical protein
VALKQADPITNRHQLPLSQIPLKKSGQTKTITSEIEVQEFRNDQWTTE